MLSLEAMDVYENTYLAVVGVDSHPSSDRLRFELFLCYQNQHRLPFRFDLEPEVLILVGYKHTNSDHDAHQLELI